MNVTFGTSSGQKLMGVSNTLVGALSGAEISTGSNNICIGHDTQTTAPEDNGGINVGNRIHFFTGPEIPNNENSNCFSVTFSESNLTHTVMRVTATAVAQDTSNVEVASGQWLIVACYRPTDGVHVDVSNITNVCVQSNGSKTGTLYLNTKFEDNVLIVVLKHEIQTEGLSTQSTSFFIENMELSPLRITKL
jgi:hypothetical protein